MIFHDQCASGGALVKHATEIKLRWLKSNSIHSEDTEKIEFNWENLISSSYFHWYAHSEFFILVNRRFLILLDQIPLASLQDAPIGFEFRPDFELSFSLDETECGIEFKVWFEILGEEKLNFHGVCASVVKNDLFSVELFVDQHIQIVFLFLYVDGYVNTCTTNCDGNGLCVVLILKE